MNNDLVKKDKDIKKIKCPKCNGTGKIENKICPTCKGTGETNLLLG